MDGRLIVDGGDSGARNMAIDEALGLAAADSGVPVLRFYRWTPATISLGYFQAYDSRATHAASQGLELVRRGSGGGAIIHHHELTYNIVLPSDSLYQIDSRQLYDDVHRAIVQVLADYGIVAELCTAAVKAAPEPFLCFQRREVGDVLVGGAKIGGSAQRRQRGVLRQHGSILLRQSEFAPELPGLEELSGQPLDAGEFQERLLGHLASTWEVTWQRGDLNAAESALVDTLATEKYGTTNWSRKR